MTSEPERRKLAATALKRVKSQFSVDRVSQQFTRLLRELI